MDKADHETITKHAYEQFVQRGGLHGQHVSDWLEAVKEVKEDKREAAQSEARWQDDGGQG